MVINNLTLDKAAIVQMLDKHLQTIIDVIYNTTDKDKRISLLKELINMILEASDELAENKQLFQKMFEFATCPKSDESMIENILWMSTSLLEQNQFNDNF
jgi:hypothetical protein